MRERLLDHRLLQDRYLARGVPVCLVKDDWYDREVKGHGRKDKGDLPGKGHD